MNKDALSAIGALSEINDHFNNGGAYDAVVGVQTQALFCFLWSLTETLPPVAPKWVSRETEDRP